LCACASEPAKPRASVLVITLDTFRPDFVTEEDMPFLVRYMKTTRHFSAARTVAGLTLPSHASLFTGLLPGRLRVHDNVGSPIPPAADRDFRLLAEEFNEAGYRSAAIVASGVLKPRTGITRGFDQALGPFDVSDRRGPGGYRGAQEQVRLVKEWLARTDGRPEFLWLHLYDSHHPYLPYEGDATRAATTATDSARERYRGELRRIDRWLEHLLSTIPEDTIVVLASDHGEGLDEHGEVTHGPLCYGSTMDQFLAVRGLSPGVDDRPRSICDVAPTLRAMCGLAARDTDGARLDGPAKPAVVSEALLTWRVHGWAQVLAASDGRYTLIESGPRVLLFDRSVDRGELHPIDLAGHPAYERLDRALRELRSTGTDKSLDLDVLGSTSPYASARRPFSYYLSRAENAGLPDPEPLLEWWVEAHVVQEHLAAAIARQDRLALETLIKQIDGLVTAAPTSPIPHQLLAKAHESLAGITQQVDFYQAAMDASVRSIKLGFVLPELFTVGLRCAIRSKCPAGMRRFVDLGVETGLVPDIPAAHLFYSVALRNGALARNSTVLLRRFRSHAGANVEIDQWIADLEEDAG